ncbi:MAG: hypothetical protein NTY23_03345 [Chloroflexi bacterium]|nr:hypothetical protein [Chloroflexota bacterium]
MSRASPRLAIVTAVGVVWLVGWRAQRWAPRGLVNVHIARTWTDYGTLPTLTPSFAESDLELASSRGPESDAALAHDFPALPICHCYCDEPSRVFPHPR